MNDFNQSLYQRRKLSNAVGLTLSMGSMVLGLAVLLWILYVLLSNGLAALDLNMFTQDTPAPGSEGGGLRNAIVGSLLMVGATVLFATPIGIFAGVYLAEYGDTSKTAANPTGRVRAMLTPIPEEEKNGPAAPATDPATLRPSGKITEPKK